MIFAWVLASVLFILSWIFDRERSLRAARFAWALFLGVLPMFLVVLVLASLSLGFISERILVDLLVGRGLLTGTAIAALAGSVAAIPGFVAFPIAGILLGKGVPYTVLGAFTTTLMMVGVVTFPLERGFLGAKAAFVRNFAGFLTAILVSLAIGFFFGELP
ncbi:MAG: permease [Thermovirga sp.]